MNLIAKTLPETLGKLSHLLFFFEVCKRKTFELLIVETETCFHFESGTKSSKSETGEWTIFKTNIYDIFLCKANKF